MTNCADASLARGRRFGHGSICTPNLLSKTGCGLADASMHTPALVQHRGPLEVKNRDTRKLAAASAQGAGLVCRKNSRTDDAAGCMLLRERKRPRTLHNDLQGWWAKMHAPYPC